MRSWRGITTQHRWSWRGTRETSSAAPTLRSAGLRFGAVGRGGGHEVLVASGAKGWCGMSDEGQTPPFAEIVNAGLEFTIPIAHGMGVRAAEVRPGFAATMVPIEGNGNHFGVMYAGVLFTVAEILGGAIAVATFDNSEFYPLVKDLHVYFRKPAKTDVRAEASLPADEIARIAEEAAAKGKSDFTLRAVVTDADGVVVAETEGLYQLRAHGK
ncbi:PaaI family thioesterase [Nocardia sp. CA-128927]|uniref:PaaI family thioesterase n=1 Tax=Nocardia sp. CA-128927 TaxID=3239975 RepID=UPI003D9908E6